MRQFFLICFLFVLHSTCKEIVRRDLDETNVNREARSSSDLGNTWNKLLDAFGCPQSKDYVCNLHNPKYNCTCYRPNQLNPMLHPSCDEVFHLQNIRAYVIELRTKLPNFPNFVENFDKFLGEIIEDYCAIPQQYLVILRKRCFNGAMLTQIAFLRATNYTLPSRIKIDNLQAVHPSIFTNNKDFMNQPYLPILNVTEVDFLTPVIRHPSETIVFGAQSKQEKPASFVSTLADTGFVIVLALIIIVGNLVPICFLWRFIRDRKTHTPSPMMQMSHL